jgi:hypothetical protein
MHKYVVILEGRNLWIDVEREVSAHGAFTVRVISADSSFEAERIAVQKIHSKHPVHELALNPPHDPAIFEARESHQLSWWSRRKDSALVLFEEGDEEGREEALFIAQEVAGLKAKN